MDKICDRDEVREGSVLIVTTDHGSYELELENSIKACLRRKRITLIVAITSWDTEDSKEAKYLSRETMRSLKRLVSYSRSGHHTTTLNSEGKIEADRAFAKKVASDQFCIIDLF